jgi:dephospho-CoA kinase
VVFIGLTGVIGSGKSEALKACGRMGAAVLSADEAVHELLDVDEVRWRTSSSSDRRS